MGEENDYYGTFLPEIKAVIAAGGKTFAPRSTPTGYAPDFAKWLKATGRKNVIIGGISIDNCTLHTSLDLIRNGYNVYVVVDASSTNSKLAEDAAIQRLILAGAIPVGWLNALTDLGKDFAGPYGKGMMNYATDRNNIYNNSKHRLKGCKIRVLNHELGEPPCILP
jgi:nicotinamidase-related amidase